MDHQDQQREGDDTDLGRLHACRKALQWIRERARQRPTVYSDGYGAWEALAEIEDQCEETLAQERAHDHADYASGEKPPTEEQR